MSEAVSSSEGSIPVFSDGVVPHLGDRLSAVEQSMRDGITDYLNGRATDEERARLLGLRQEYVEALYNVGRTVLTSQLDSGHDEAEAKGQLIGLFSDSICTTMGDAHADHHQESRVERTRHYFEQTRSRRWAGAAITTLLFGVTTLATAKGIEVAEPTVIRPVTGGTVVGTSVTALFMRYFKPKDAIKSLIKKPSRKARNIAQGGINKHALHLIQEVDREVQDIDGLNPEEQTRWNYVGVSRRLHGTEVRERLSVELVTSSIETEEQRSEAVRRAAGLAVGYLFGYYGADADKKDEKLVGRLKSKLRQNTQKPAKI